MIAFSLRARLTSQNPHDVFSSPAELAKYPPMHVVSHLPAASPSPGLFDLFPDTAESNLLLFIPTR